METQPQKGNLLAAEKNNLSDITAEQRAFLLNPANANALIIASEERGTGARRLRKELEAASIADHEAPKPTSEKMSLKNKIRSTLGRMGIKAAFAGGLIASVLAPSGNSATANETPAPAPSTIESVSNSLSPDSAIDTLMNSFKNETIDDAASHEADATWDIEYLTDSKDKRYEKNFGPSYEGKMDKDSVVADILDRAKKDPAFLAAMTASCGAIEQGDVDTCSLAYAGDLEQRKAAYTKLADLLQDENTTMTHFVYEGTFSSTYFSGTKTEMINGEEVTVPKIGYSTNQKVRVGADDRQKYVAKFVNAEQGLDTELRPDCGWQYNIHDEAKMVGVPQVTHELQESEPAEVTPESVIPIYINNVPESENPIVEIPQAFAVVPEAPAPTPELQPEAPVTPDQLQTPEQPIEQPTEPTTPLEEIPVAPTPDETIEVPEVEKPELPIAPTPELIVPIIPEKPVEPEKPVIPIAPTPDTTFPLPEPEKPVPEKPDGAKDWTKSLDKPDGLDPSKVKADEVTKDPIEAGNGTKSKNIDGKPQSVREEVKIEAPQVEKDADTPIYNQMKREQEKAEALRKAAETEATKRQAAVQEQQRKVQAETDRKAAEMEKQMAEKDAMDKAAEEMRQKIVEQERQEALNRSKQKAEAEKPTLQNPEVNATAPTETTNETNN